MKQSMRVTSPIIGHDKIFALPRASTRGTSSSTAELTRVAAREICVLDTPPRGRGAAPSGRDRPQCFVIRNQLKRHAGCLEYRPLCQHRLEGVHLMRRLQRFPHAHVNQVTGSSIDAYVVTEQTA